MANKPQQWTGSLRGTVSGDYGLVQDPALSGGEDEDDVAPASSRIIVEALAEKLRFAIESEDEECAMINALRQKGLRFDQKGRFAVGQAHHPKSFLMMDEVVTSSILSAPIDNLSNQTIAPADTVILGDNGLTPAPIVRQDLRPQDVIDAIDKDFTAHALLTRVNYLKKIQTAEKQTEDRNHSGYNNSHDYTHRSKRVQEKSFGGAAPESSLGSPPPGESPV